MLSPSIFTDLWLFIIIIIITIIMIILITRENELIIIISVLFCIFNFVPILCVLSMYLLCLFLDFSHV